MAPFVRETGRNRRAVLQVAATYVGTVVGAGFASGQEVLQFFTLYGPGATWGILLAGTILALFGFLVLNAGRRVRACSHRDILRAVVAPALARPLDGVITLFLLGGLAAMAAGAGAVVREQLGYPGVLGSTLLMAAAVATVLLGIEGVVRAIGAVVPFLVGAVLLVALGRLPSHAPAPVQPPPVPALFPSWPLAALAYGSYNLVLSLAVLGPLGRVSPRSSLLPGALLGGTLLAACALAIHWTLLTLEPALLARAEVPMLAAARRLTPALGTVYALVLLAEVYTTAVGNLFGLASRLSHAVGPPDRQWHQVTLGTGLLGWLVAQVGFASLVRNLYGWMGLAGILLLASLLRHGVRELRAGG